jgi:hypothetical protein
LQKRREVGLLISNPSVARQLLQVFEADWAAAGGKSDEAKGKKEDAKELAKEAQHA